MDLYLINKGKYNAIGIVEQEVKEVIKFLIREGWLDCNTRDWNHISLADRLCIKETNVQSLLNEFETYSDETIKMILGEFGFSIKKITLWNSVEWFHNNTLREVD